MRCKRRLVPSLMLASCDRLWVVPPLTIYTDFTWTVAQPPLGGSILVAGHHNTRSYYTEIIQKEIAASNYAVKYIFFIFSYNKELQKSHQYRISYIMCSVPCNLVSAAGTPWSSPAAGGWTLGTSPEDNIGSMFSFSHFKMSYLSTGSSAPPHCSQACWRSPACCRAGTWTQTADLTWRNIILRREVCQLIVSWLSVRSS